MFGAERTGLDCSGSTGSKCSEKEVTVADGYSSQGYGSTGNVA
jgi:hypothetical protein